MRNGRHPTTTVGLIGLGYWGPNLLRVLVEMEDVDVGIVCDLNEERVQRFARRYPSLRSTTDPQAVIEDPNIDAVIIATPAQTHGALARLTLEAGKHTFVEKPLASSADQAEELVALATRLDLVLMSGLTFLYSPPVRMIKQLLERRELGELYFISSSRVNLGPYRKDVSVVYDLAPHDFSMLLYWMEEMPTSVTAVGRDAIRDGIADVAFITMQFPSGVVANLEVSWIAPSKLRRTVLVGSKKMVVYDDVSVEQVKIFDKGFDYHKPETFGEYQLATRTGDVVIPNLESVEPLTVELDEFVGAVRSGEWSLEPLLLSRDVVRLVEAADGSLRKNIERLANGDSPELIGALEAVAVK